MPDTLDASVGLSDQRPQDKFGCKFCEKRRRGVGIPLAPSGPQARLGTLITSVTQRGNGYASLARQLRVPPGVWINLGRVCEKRRAAMAYRCAVLYGPQCASWAAASEEEEALSLITGELSDVQLFPTNGRIHTEFVEGRRPAPTRQT